MGWLDLVKCGRFGALLEKTLENEIAKRPNRNEICDEIAACYTGLLRLLHVECCTSFRFPDYEGCRFPNPSGYVVKKKRTFVF